MGVAMVPDGNPKKLEPMGRVDRTLGPEGFLPVQPGDVVGYFMSRVGIGLVRGMEYN